MKTIAFVLAILSITNCQGQDLDKSRLKDLKGKVHENIYPNIDGIIIEHDDRIIMEEYFNGFKKDSLHDTRSAFKSITSLLAGIAIDKKLIAIDESIHHFFPELKNQDKGNITVRNLLEMKSGLDCEEFYGIGPNCEDEMWEAGDWIDFCLNVDVKSTPGLNWSYNSNDPMLIGEIISRASGMTIMEFARKNLFKPLGIENYRWTISPKGRGMTAGSFFIRPIDMIKIIGLVKGKGNWKGNQIVSAEWIEKSTNCETDIDYSFFRYSRLSDAKYQSAKYGFYWYRENLLYKGINTEVLFASGNGGQYMMLLSDYNAKVVFTGSNYGNWKGKLPFEILLKYIIPIIENENSR